MQQAPTIRRTPNPPAATHTTNHVAFPQDPTAHHDPPHTRPTPFPPETITQHPKAPDEPAVLDIDHTCDQPKVSVPPVSTTPEANVLGAALDTISKPATREPKRHVLLRKEVIQPHLPVRLPCYDFVPIADPTFDSSLSHELGHWLRVLPTFVT